MSMYSAESPHDENENRSTPDKQINRTKRQRVARACNRCKRHKIKCDGCLPCKPCDKHHQLCQYHEVKGFMNKQEFIVTTTPSHLMNYQLQPPPPPIQDQSRTPLYTNNPIITGPYLTQGPPPSYVHMLENRVSQLEEELRYSNSRATENTRTGFNGSAKSEEEIQLAKQIFLSTSKARVLRRPHMLLTPALGKNLHESLPDEFKSQIKVPRLQTYGFNLGGRHYLKPRPVGIITAFNFIIQKQVDGLLAYFFDEINPIYTIIHKDAFKIQYDRVIEQYPPIIKDKEVLFYSITALICAISMRFSETRFRNIYRHGLEEQFFEEAYNVLQNLSFEWESAELVQGWLLVSLYLRTCHRQVSCFNALGRALRICQGLSLCVDATLTKFPPYHAFKMRNVFWICYICDIEFSLLSGRMPTLVENFITIPFPSLNDWEKEFKYGWFSVASFAMLQLSYLMRKLRPLTDNDDYSGKELHSIETQLKELDIWLRKFNMHSDTILDNTPGVHPTIVACIRLYYNNVISTLHLRTLFPLFSHDIPESHSGRSIERCYQAADGTITVMEHLQKLDSNYILAPWGIFSAFIYAETVVALTLASANIYGIKANLLVQRGIKIITFYSGCRLNQVVNSATNEQQTPMFGMARECEWAVKTLNKMLVIRLKESASYLEGAGIEEAESNEVNKENFHERGSYGKDGLIEKVADSMETENITSGNRTQIQNSQLGLSDNANNSNGNIAEPMSSVYPVVITSNMGPHTSRNSDNSGNPPITASDSVPFLENYQDSDFASTNFDSGLGGANIQWFDEWNLDLSSSVFNQS